MKRSLALTAFAGALALTGCAAGPSLGTLPAGAVVQVGKVNDKQGVTVILVDVTDAANHPATKARYVQDASVVVAAVAAQRGRLFADDQRSDPLTSDTVPVQVDFAPTPGVPDNQLWRSADLKRKQTSAMIALQALLDGPPSNGPDDIVATLLVAERIFAAHPDASRRQLILLSTMNDQHIAQALNDDSSPEAVNSAVDKLRASGRLAHLRGIAVTVAGAGIDNSGAGQAGQAITMQKFWDTFFAAAGATLPKGSYGGRLLSLP